MFQNLFHHTRLLNECNYPHSTETLRANEGIDFIDFLYQSRPISPGSLAGQFRFKKAGDFIVGAPDNRIEALHKEYVLTPRGRDMNPELGPVVAASPENRLSYLSGCSNGIYYSGKQQRYKFKGNSRKNGRVRGRI